MAQDKTKIIFNPLSGKFDAVQDVSGLAATSDLAAYQTRSEKSQPNGYASLDSFGKIPQAQVPGIAITDTYVVASQAAMLALSTAETGDIAVRTDLNKTLILKGTTYSTLSDWQELLTPTDAVQSVNGKTGTVTLTTTDISEGTNLYYTPARFDTRLAAKSTTDLAEGTNLYFTNTRAQTAAVQDTIADAVTNIAPSQNAVFDALVLKADLASPALTGTPTAPTAATTTNTTQLATTAFVQQELVAGAGANRALSNLTTTAVNRDLLPGANITRTLGSTVLNWLRLYVGKLASASGDQLDVALRALLFDGAAVASWFNSGFQLAAGNLLRFTNTAGTQTLGFSAPTLSTSTDYLLPAAPPTVSGQSLVSTIAGEMSWLDTDASGNFIKNGQAELVTSSIFVPYADAAAPRPVDGTGGSPTVTSSVTSVAPLSGTKSYLLTKPASNTQGQGWAIPFTAPLASLAKAVKIYADYIVNSGTFVPGNNSDTPSDGDLIWYVYDVTNSVLIEPSNIKMFASSTTLSDKFEATFQTSATGTSYRLIAHCASTSALAYELKVDNVSVSPSAYVYGTPVTDWQSYTPTGSWTTNTTYSGKFRRVGDTMEIQAQVNLTGAPNATILTINYPTGYTFDSTKLPTGTTDNGSTVFGTGGSIRLGVSNQVLFSRYNGANSFVATAQNAGGTFTTDVGVTNSAPVTWGNGDVLYFKLAIPIQGWSSSTRVSDGYDSRPVTMEVNGTPTGTVSNAPSVLVYPNVANDTVAGYSAGIYTVKTAGFYRVSVTGAIISTVSQGHAIGVQLYKGALIISFPFLRASATLTSTSYGTGANWSGWVNAGETFSTKAYTDGSSNSLAGTTWSFSLSKDQAPQTISASELVSAIYYLSSNLAMTANTTRVNFDTKEQDTHNAVTTGTSWQFKAPVAGTYRISTSGWVTTGATTFYLSRSVGLARNLQVITSSGVAFGSVDIYMNAGDTFHILGDASVTLTALLNTRLTTAIYISLIK